MTSSVCKANASLIVCMALAGCQLPDVGPFVEGTAQLRGAVAASGAAVEQELRHGLGADEYADKLKTDWEARNASMIAMLRYAQSLSEIVAAGNEGSASAGKVADAVRGLAEAAGIAIPGSPAAAAVATDAVKFLYGQIATIRAADQLAGALDEAQPAVEKIAHLMRRDLEDLEVIAQATTGLQALDAITNERNQLASDRKLVLKALNTAADAAQKAATAKEGAMHATTEIANAKAAEAEKAAEVAASKEDEAKKAAERESASWEEYTRFTALLADMNIRYAAYQNEIAKMEERLNAMRSVIDACGRALDEWAAAHAELASAARAKRPSSARAMLEAALELRDLVTRMREQ